MSRLILSFLFLTFYANNSFAQCPTWPNMNDCGPILAEGGLCNSNTIFCIGDSVGIHNLTTINVDSSFICWDDGTIQGFAGNFQGCIKHKYNYAPDSCVGGNGQIQKQIRVGIKKTCAGGESFHYISTPVDIKFKPKAAFSASPMIVCVNQPVSITNNSCPNSLSPTHDWDFGDGTGSSALNPVSHTYTSPGTYTINYTITNSCGASTDMKTIIVLPPTVIQPVITLTDQCTPAMFVPDVNSQNVVSYLWITSPLSGITVTLPIDSQPAFNVTNSGTYNINLNVTGCCSSIGSICQWDTSLTFYQGPNLTLNPIPVFCNSTTINPTNYISISGNISQYNWLFPGGSPSSSNAANPGNVTYATPGTFPLTLIVNSPCGTDSIVDSVRVLPPTTIAPTIIQNGNCAPLTMSGNMNSANGTGYTWNISPGSAGTILNPSSQQTVIDINNPGTITISAISAGCCNAPQSNCNWDTTITIVQGPGLNSSPLPALCNSGTITPSNFFSVSGSATTFTWDFPGGTPSSSSSQNPGVIVYSGPGTYTITLNVSGSCGTDSISEILSIGASPIINISPSDLFGCDSLTVNFVNTSPIGQIYNWTANNGNFINGTTSTSSEPTILFTSPGIYQIEVSASTPGCNPMSQTFNIEIGNAPQLSMITSINDICDSAYINLTDYFSLTPSTSDSGYSWNVYHNNNNYFNYSGTNPPSVYIQDTGVYIISVLAWNACDSIVLTDTFSFNFPPVLILPSDTIVCKGSGSIPLIAIPIAGTWSWNGLSITSGVFNTGQTFQEVNYLLYTYGVATCQVRDSFLISVIGANINAGNDTVLCGNSSPFNLSGIPVPGIWTGEGIVDSITGYYDPSLVTNSPDAVVYTYFESVSGCIVIDTVMVTVFQPTTGGFSLPDTACVNQPIVFSDTIPNTTAYWDFGDGSGLITANTVTHTYTQTGIFNVTLIIENIYGCRDTVYNDIEIAEPPDASFTLDLHSGCAVLPVTITNQSGFYGGNIYYWNYGNSTSDSLYSPGTILFDQGPGDSTIYHIELMVLNGCGTALFNDSIVVYPIPVPEFGVIYSDSCSPALVMFNNISTGNPQNYQWYINGIFVSADSILQQQIFLADSTDSTYVIMLIAGNFCGQDTILKNVTIHPNQVSAFFNADIVYGCKPLEVTFTSFVAANSVIQWEFGDGTTGNGNTITHIYDTSGVFVVWQYVDNYCGFDSISQTIEVLDQPVLSFSIPEKHCNNVPLVILNTSTNTSGAIWNFGDGSPLDSVSFSPVHLYSTPGVYTLTMIGFASGTGCTDTITALIEIVGHPVASFSVSPIDGCIPLTINLASNSTGTLYHVWDLGNGDTTLGQLQSYTYMQSGQYSISLTAIDANGCKDDTSFSYINVYPIPDAIFDYTQSPMCQLPSTVNFINSSTGSSSYFWNFGVYGISNQQMPSLTFSNQATFNATLISQNIFGCADTQEREVVVYAKPIAQFSPDTATGCPPTLITFINNSQFFNQVYWDFGDGSNSTELSPAHIYLLEGNYSTTLIVGMDSVCFDTLTILNNVVVKPKPESIFTINPIIDTIVNPSGLYSFTDNSIDAVKWYWSFGDGGISFEQNPVHRYYSNGVMYVMQVVFNEFGCPDTSYQTIIVSFLGSLFIPNAFSPDAGTEETMYFIPKGVGIKEYLIEVFSPYGEKVWSSTKLQNGQPQEKWDGTFNDKPLPQGAYVWKAFALFESGEIWNGMVYDDKKPVKVGSVTILR